MTHHLRRIIEIIGGQLPEQTDVLEIGSRQGKNQQEIADLRQIFKYHKYTGIDMNPGPGVDRIANAEKLPFIDSTFSLVLCLETLEHAKKPWVVADEMVRVLKENGMIIVSSQQNYPLHLHPSDFYRFTPYGLESLFKQMKTKLIFSVSPTYAEEYKMNPQTVVFIGWKNMNKKLADRIKNSLQKNTVEISGHKPYRHRIIDGIKFIRRGLFELKYFQKIYFWDIK